MKKNILKTAIVAGAIFFWADAFAFTAVASGAWTNSATWGGIGPGTTVTAQDIIIPAGITVDMDVDVTFSGVANSFTVNGSVISPTDRKLTITSGTFSGTGSTSLHSLILNSALTNYNATGALNVKVLSNQGSTIPFSSNVSVSDSLDLNGGSVLLNSGCDLSLGMTSRVCVDNGNMVIAGGTFTTAQPYSIYYRGSTKTIGSEVNPAFVKDVHVMLNSSAEDLIIASDLVIGGNLNMASGHIQLNGTKLTLMGDYNGGPSAQFETTNAEIVVDGAAGPLTSDFNFSPGSTLSHLTIDRNLVTYRLESPVIITDTLHLLDGVLRLLPGATLSMAAGSDVHVYDGTLYPTGGTFDGALQYNVYYSGPSYTCGLELSGAGLNNVTVNLFAYGMSVSMDDDVTVNGRFYLQKGMFNIGNHKLQLKGTYDRDSFGKFQGTALSILHLNLTTVSNDTLVFDSNAWALNELIVENPLGSVVALGSNVSIHGVLAFISGKVDVADGQLTIGTVGTVTGNSDTNYVVTSGTGSMRMYIYNSVAHKLFPVGTMSSYSPASLQQVDTGTAGYMKVRVIDGVYDGGSTGNNIATWASCVNRTWIVDSDPLMSLVTNVRVYWTQGAEVNGFDRNNAYLSHYLNSAWDSDTAEAAVAGPFGTYRLTRQDGFTDAGEFAVVDSSVPLQVEDQMTTGITIYPVPTSDVLNVNLSDEQKGIVQFELYDAAGNLINTFAGSNTRNQIDLSDYSNGYYVLRMIFSDGSFITRKVVKS